MTPQQVREHNAKVAFALGLLSNPEGRIPINDIQNLGMAVITIEQYSELGHWVVTVHDPADITMHTDRTFTLNVEEIHRDE